VDNSVDSGDRWKKTRKNLVEKSNFCGRKNGKKKLPKILTESDNDIFVNFLVLHRHFDTRQDLDVNDKMVIEQTAWKCQGVLQS
jgi:hypothetical protein